MSEYTYGDIAKDVSWTIFRVRNYSEKIFHQSEIKARRNSKTGKYEKILNGTQRRRLVHVIEKKKETERRDGLMKKPCKECGKPIKTKFEEKKLCRNCIRIEREKSVSQKINEHFGIGCER